MSGENEPKLSPAGDAAEDLALQAELDLFEPLLEGARPTPYSGEQRVFKGGRPPKTVFLGKQGDEAL